MYATNNNCQAKESRSRIVSALFCLMHEYQYKEITVTQICQQAQIARQTFYRNFDLKDDIIEFYLNDLVKRYFADYYQEGDALIQLNSFFTYMLEHKEFLLLASINDFSFMINQTIASKITKFINLQQLTTIRDPELESYVTGFIASTISSLLSLWVENEFKESPEKIAHLAKRFLEGLSSNDDFF